MVVVIEAPTPEAASAKLVPLYMISTYNQQQPVSMYIISRAFPVKNIRRGRNAKFLTPLLPRAGPPAQIKKNKKNCFGVKVEDFGEKKLNFGDLVRKKMPGKWREQGG